MPRRPTVVACLLFLGVAVFSEPLRHLASIAFRAPLVVLHGGVRILAWLPSLPALSEQQAALRRELASHQLELIRLRETIRRLTRAQQLQEAASQPGVVASILGRTVLPTEHVVLVDRGRRDGIAPETVLVDEQGLVGRILQVHETTSTAVLLTDPSSRVAGLVERSRESGLLMGTGGSLIEFVYLDLEADIQIGDRVVTAGLGGSFPTGLAVGTVVRLARDERSASTTAWVSPAVKVRRLEEVLCVPPAASEAEPEHYC